MRGYTLQIFLFNIPWAKLKKMIRRSDIHNYDTRSKNYILFLHFRPVNTHKKPLNPIPSKLLTKLPVKVNSKIDFQFRQNQLNKSHSKESKHP